MLQSSSFVTTARGLYQNEIHKLMKDEDLEKEIVRMQFLNTTICPIEIWALGILKKNVLLLD